MKRSVRSRLLVPLVLLVAAADGLAAAPDGRGSPPDPLLEILREWSSSGGGDLTAVPWLLSFVEARVRDRGGRPGPLTRESKQLRKLFAETPMAYVPVIDLYVRAHLLAFRSGKGRTAMHLRVETVRLIEEFMTVRRDERGWDLASRFTSLLAASLRNGPELDVARRLFDSALEIDPENPVALHAAAAIQEKYGSYSSAAALLRRLLALHELPDAELRLALCLNRMGKSNRAEEHLERLAHGDAAAWVRAIAYQEWSQLRLASGDPDTALTLAREGHEELPDDDSLAILVAFLAGPRDARSDAVVHRLTSAPTGTGATARGLYNLWPAGMDDTEAEIRKEVEAAMPELREAISAASGSGSMIEGRASEPPALR